MSPPMFTDAWDVFRKYGIESANPELNSKVSVKVINGNRYAIQSGTPQVGGLIGVNGGLTPTAVYPADPCNTEFWTCKQGYLRSWKYEKKYDDWRERVIDSSIALFHLDSSGAVKESIDLEPVILSIITNIQTRTDTYERVPVAKHWINPWYYDRYTGWETTLTSASPDYTDIPESYETHTVQFKGSNRNRADHYIRPASYAGILGPVYAGVKAVTDVTTLEPWKSMIGPGDPANIHARDIHLDSKGNLWVLLQIGWQYCDVFSNEVKNTSYMGYENMIAVQYDTAYQYGSSANPTIYPAYSNSYFSRQYIPPHTGTYAEQVDRMYRCGLPTARMFLICFNKATKFKTWDYLPFIPGTVGFKGKYYIDSRIRGPCMQTIARPPLKLDSDRFGNVYGCCGTWFGVDRFNSYPSNHWEGISYAFNEFMYFYQRLDADMATIVTEGLDVGRIGPHVPGGYGSCTLWRYDLDTTAYKGKTSGSNKVCYKSPWTYTIGGDRACLTLINKSGTTEQYWLTNFGNRAMCKCKIQLDASAAFPHPTFIGGTSSSDAQMPYNVRNWRSEWYYVSGSDSGRELAMEMDLLFSQCDLFTRNYYLTSGVGNVQPTLANMRAFDPASWWEYEEEWRGALISPSQLPLDKPGFFQVGSATGDVINGFNVSESPMFLYSNTFHIGTAYYELQAAARSGIGTVYFQRIPLNLGSDQYYDQIFRPASTLYVPTVSYNDHQVVSPIINGVLASPPVASPVMPKTYLVSSWLTNSTELGSKFVGKEGMLMTCTWGPGQVYPDVYWTSASPSLNTLRFESGTDRYYQCIIASYGDPRYNVASWEYRSPYFEKCSILGAFPTIKTRLANEDLVIQPMYNFKYEMFTFSGISWDSYASLLSKYNPMSGSLWPYRMHTLKVAPAVASESGLDPASYGPRSSYLNPTKPLDDDYEPKTGERIVRYTSGFIDAVATVTAAAKGGDAAAQQALDQFNQYLASVKFSIYETVMQDQNFGSFGSSIRCKDLAGILVTMPLLHATYTHENGNWNLNLIWDPSWGKRLYVITHQVKDFDRKWELLDMGTLKRWKVTDTKQYPALQYPMVTAIAWTDLSNEQIKQLKQWEPDLDYAQYIVEKWQTLCFIKEYPNGSREAPQITSSVI